MDQQNTVSTFPPGFDHWKETFFEIAAYLSKSVKRKNSISHRVFELKGQMGLYALASTLTDKFELENCEKDWEQFSFIETLQHFLHEQDFAELA